MFKPTVFFAKALVAAAMVVFATAQPALAQRGAHGGGRGGAMHGGGFRGGGFRGGFGVGIYASPYGYGGWGYPYYYGPDYYSSAPYYYSSPAPYYQGAPVVPDTGYQSNYPTTIITDTTAMIEVQLPPNAELWFDGHKTAQTGPVRYFATPPLTPGQTFNYELRAAWMVNGAPTTMTRAVQVQAGKRSAVNFMAGGPQTNE